MSFAPEIWSQLKALTAKEIIKALKRDGWAEEERRGATRSFAKQATNGTGRRLRIVVHYHPKKTYGAKLLQGLLDETGWGVDDLVRLKLVTKKTKKNVAQQQNA